MTTTSTSGNRTQTRDSFARATRWAVRNRRSRALCVLRRPMSRARHGTFALLDAAQPLAIMRASSGRVVGVCGAYPNGPDSSSCADRTKGLTEAG